MSVEFPDSPTVDAFEHSGRLLDTDATAPTPPQVGCCTVPLAFTQPVLDTIDQASPPDEMTPLGAMTVSEQLGPEVMV